MIECYESDAVHQFSLATKIQLVSASQILFFLFLESDQSHAQDDTNNCHRFQKCSKMMWQMVISEDEKLQVHLVSAVAFKSNQRLALTNKNIQNNLMKTSGWVSSHHRLARVP